MWANSLLTHILFAIVCRIVEHFHKLFRGYALKLCPGIQRQYVALNSLSSIIYTIHYGKDDQITSAASTCRKA